MTRLRIFSSNTDDHTTPPPNPLIYPKLWSRVMEAVIDSLLAGAIMLSAPQLIQIRTLGAKTFTYIPTEPTTPPAVQRI
ncbi:MAG: hypothetical protein M1813_008851 [Trichoglossum hirsutum]|nr:MAG: hypothetical protein M1813_008851 [Trichoglossum hirsutum]